MTTIRLTVLTIISAVAFAAAALFTMGGSSPFPEGDFCRPSDSPIPVICEDDVPCSAIPAAVDDGSCKVLPLTVNTDPNP